MQTDAEAHFELGKLAFAQGDNAAAILHFERAVAAQPSFNAAWYQLSLSYRRNGQEEKSREALENFRQNRNEAKHPTVLTGCVCCACGRFHSSDVTQGLGYFPVAIRLNNGDVLAVVRGGAAHVGIKGRLDLVRSSMTAKHGRSLGPQSTKPRTIVIQRLAN